MQSVSCYQLKQKLVYVHTFLRPSSVSGFIKMRSAAQDLLRQMERTTGQRDGEWRDALLQRPVCGALCFAKAASVTRTCVWRLGPGRRVD